MSERPFLDALAHPNDYTHLSEVFIVPPPAAGAGWSFTIPGDRAARVRSVAATFATSAVVANRTQALAFGDGTTNLGNIFQPLLLAANSGAFRYSWIFDLGWAIGGSGASTACVGCGDLVLPPGWVLSSRTNGIDVGDQWSSIAVWLETVSTQPFGVRQARAEGLADQMIASSLAAEGFS